MATTKPMVSLEPPLSLSKRPMCLRLQRIMFISNCTLGPKSSRCVLPSDGNDMNSPREKKTLNLQTLTSAEATRLAGEDPDYGTRKLYKAIDLGKYPEYTVHIVRKLYLSFTDPPYLYLANNGPKVVGLLHREPRVLPAHRI
jgi:hypothetical protein